MPEFDQIQGERILYESSDELRACAGNVAHLDAAILSFEATLGVTAPRPLRYSWLSEADIPDWRYRRPGDELLGGEAIGLHAWAEDPANVHEVVHLVAGGDNVPPFFREGLAVALDQESGSRGLGFLDNDPPDPRPYMAVAHARDLDYYLAGVFINFLLMRHGPDKFMHFYRTIFKPFTMKRIRATFAESFGVDLDDEVEIFRSGGLPACDTLVFDVPPIECTAARVPWQTTTLWEIAPDMDCDDPGVVGGDAPDGTWWRSYDATLEVDTPGDYRLSNSGGATGLRFGACFSCPGSAPPSVLAGVKQTDLRLSPGLHYVRVFGPPGPDARVTLERTSPLTTK